MGYSSWIMRRLLWVVLTLVWLQQCSTSPMEDKLETELDQREPRSFADHRYNLLSVRVGGFNEMSTRFPDGHEEKRHIGNWEVFAKNYWYETRTVNSSCPMIPEGISAEADWALMVPCMFGNVEKPPRIIFVHNHMLPHFVESPLRFMNTSSRFVLVSGGTDMTVPRQIDQRYRQPFRGFGGNDGGNFFNLIVSSPMVIHWFAENRDLLHPKLSTLPTAMSISGNPDALLKDIPDPSTILPVTQRPMKVLSSDRVRTGTGQWGLRAEVKGLCSSMPEICLTPPDAGSEGIARTDYLELLVSAPFVACVKGGGIDPSPKAWESILAGTIPIIQSTWLDDAYSQLPLVIIHDWHTVFNQSRSTTEIQAMLHAWASALAPYYEVGSAKRNATLERLRTKYWLGKMQHKIAEYDATEAAGVGSAAGSSHRALRGAPSATNATVAHRRSHDTDALPHHLAIIVPRAAPAAASSAVPPLEQLPPMKRALSDGFFIPNHPATGKVYDEAHGPYWSIDDETEAV